MCLTIPKKVIALEKDFVEVQPTQGKKERVGTLVNIKKGDWVLTQNNVIISKIKQKEVKEILKILKK